MFLSIKFARIAFFLFVFINSLVAKTMVSGRVVDSQSNDPLPMVNIAVDGTVLGTVSDLDGNFSLINLPPGAYTLKFTMMGYERVSKKVELGFEQSLTLDVKMLETAFQTQELIVTASKRAQRISDTPNSVAVITSKDLEDKSQIYLDQLLEYVPGVSFVGTNVNIRGSSGFSYGAGSRVLFLVDGVPAMSSDTGDIKWDLVPASQIDHVEIVKTAGSALYGSNALGGVINVITKEAGLKPETNVRYSAGFYDEPPYPEWDYTDELQLISHVDVDHSRKFGDHSFFVSAGHHYTDGYRQNGGYYKYNLGGKLFLKLSDSQNLRISTNFEDGESDVGLMWLNQNKALSVDPKALGDYTDSYKFGANAIHQWAINKKFGLHSRLSYFRNGFENMMHDNNDHSTGQKTGMEIRGNYMLNDKHSLTFGTEETYDDVDYFPVGQHNMMTTAFYIQDEYKVFPATVITVGGRYDYITTNGDQIDTQFSPKFGMVYHLTEYTTLRLSSGKGFRAPGITEKFSTVGAAGIRLTPNPDLKPETAWSHEIGLSSPLTKNFMIDVALFNNEYWNLIEPDAFTPGGFIFQFKNLIRARIRGAETNLNYSFLNRNLTGQVGYTFLDAEDVDSGGPLAYRSKHNFKWALSYRYGRMEAGINYIFHSRLDEVKVYPNDKRDDQLTTNAHFSINYTKWSFIANANNIFNHAHTQAERTILPIRHYTGTVKIHF